jgi:UDP-N-acetylglucosamine:LPS N-acetylglucosamine transferase
VLPGQEEGNADYVIQGKAGERALDPVSALETIYHWLDQKGALLNDLAENARRLGRPRAAYQIAERVGGSRTHCGHLERAYRHPDQKRCQATPDRRL